VRDRRHGDRVSSPVFTLGRSRRAPGSRDTAAGSADAARSAARLVVTLGLLAGIAFAPIVPPLAGYDEPEHFARADQVSQGHLIASHRGNQLGGDLPVAMRNDLVHVLRQVNLMFGHHPNAPTSPASFLRQLGDPAARGPQTFVDFRSSAVYSPVPYAPASLLMAIGRALGASTMLLIYLGRLGSLLGTVALLALAARRVPTRATLLAAIALLPVTIVQAAMLSADGVTLALTLLELALALHLAATPRDEVSRGQLAEIAFATVALGFVKPPYILIALAFAIPWRRHGTRVRRAIGAAVASGFAAAAAWGAYASHVYIAPALPVQLTGTRPFAPFHDVDPHAQERYVLHHLVNFAFIIRSTVATYPGRLTREAVAQVPFWTLPAAIAILAAVPLAAALFARDAGGDARGDPPVIGARGRVLLLGLAAVTFVGLMFLAYIGWNALAAPRVEAFQGRYLLP
jgi:uncharacterized membrane protein